jgi:hypothetical protein
MCLGTVLDQTNSPETWKVWPRYLDTGIFNIVLPPRAQVKAEVTHGGRVGHLTYTPALVCLLAQDMGSTSQGHATVHGSPEIQNRGPVFGT